MPENRMLFAFRLTTKRSMSLVMTMVQLVLNNWPRARKKGDPGVPVPLRRGQMALIAYDLKKDGVSQIP